MPRPPWSPRSRVAAGSAATRARRRPARRRRVPGRVRGGLLVHRRLRPDRRVRHVLVGDRVEPDDPHARRLRPRRRPGGERLVPDIATTVPAPDRRRPTYTFHLKHGVKFGPPVNREVTSQDVLYAFERIAHPKDGAEYAFYYSPIAGFDAYARRQGEVDLGDRDAGPEHDRLPPHEADGRLPLPAGAAGDRADPRRGREVLRGPGRTVRARRRLDRPVHDRGRRPGRRLVVRRAEADERVRRAHEPRPSSATPTTTRRPTRPPRAQSLPDEFRVHRRRRTPPTSSTASRPASSRTRTPSASRRQALEQYATDPAEARAACTSTPPTGRAT